METQQGGFGIELRDQAPCFHWHRAVPVGDEAFAPRIGCVVERRLGVAAGDGVLGAHVFARRFMYERIAGSGLLDRGNCWQLVELHLDQLQCVFGNVPVLRDHHRDGFADIAYLVDGDRSLQKPFEPVERRQPQWDDRQLGVQIGGAKGVDHAFHRAR